MRTPDGEEVVNPADTVIEQAVDVIRRWYLDSPSYRRMPLSLARALHAAGLLDDAGQMKALRNVNKVTSAAIHELVAENAELRDTVAAVRSVCQNTDGDWLDGDAEIPVGEVLRMLTLDGTRALDGAGER